MAHLLIIDLPGGNDSDILEAAKRRGDQVTFLTSDLDMYLNQAAIKPYMDAAYQLIEVKDFAFEAVLAKVLAVHQMLPIEAVLCLIEIRLLDASKLATVLGTHYLNLNSAVLLRDKYSVRRCLAQKGIIQPEFALATTTDEIKSAIHKLGLPLLIKPSDGYGSQNVVVLQTQLDLDPLISPVEIMLPSRADYGLGVRANDRLLIERFLKGSFIGVDTLTVEGVHRFLGINVKKMMAPPSFAIQGGCFTPRNETHAAIEKYVFEILDAVGFNSGATHIELMLTEQGPRLIEINPRLVGAKIARLVGYALGRSIHEDLIDIHLGKWPQGLENIKSHQVAVSRWYTSPVAGTLMSVTAPHWVDTNVKCVEFLKKEGDRVLPAFENAERLGYVMVCGQNEQAAIELAERYIDDTDIFIEQN